MRKEMGRRRKGRMTVLVVCVLLFTLGAYFTSNNLEPVLETACANEARILCNSALNRSLELKLEQINAQCADLIIVKRDSLGQITTLETNSVEVNKLQAMLSEAVNDELQKTTEQTVSIPLGTLTGIQLLSGKGPKIDFLASMYSHVGTDISNSFDTAGINQTRHQVIITFDISMTALLADYSTTVNVTNDVCIAETIIVGTVPQTFADINSP